MDKENGSTGMMDIEYVPIYQKRLGDALTYAKGKQSMAEFANKCGFSPITFSRIVNGSIKKPLSQEEIRRIAENSDLPTEEIFEDLMRSNGMVPKDDNTPRRKESEKRGEMNRQRRETVQNVVIRSLFERGYTIAPVFNTPLEETDPTLQESRFGLRRRMDFALRVNGYEPAYWNFRINSFTGEEFAKDPDKYAREVNYEVRDVFFRDEDQFLREVWEPEAFENTRFSFVFANKDLFEGFFRMLEGVKFNNSFSLILIDINKQRVVEERLLPRHDGKEEKSLF